MARKSALVIALMAALSSGGAQALGLGDIVVRSGLNQPLEAEIPLTSAQDVDIEVLRANLASVEAFERAGVEPSYFLNSIRFSPVALGDGRKVLRLRTKDPVKEPFLNFIVEVNWPSGRMQREYTLLMDPPVFAERSRPAAVSAPVVSTPRRAGTAPAPTYAGSYSGESYGPTGGSDTLWSIANKVRNGHSTAQTMVALYQANPDAFSARNMNSLRQGQTLKVPSGESIDAVSMSEARRLMIAHNQAWATRSGVSDEPRAVVDAGQGDESPTSTPVETGDGRLKLVTPPSAKASDDGAIRDRLSGVVEAQETLSKENEELRAQLGQLASQMDKLTQLVKLKDEQLAALQAGKPLPAAPTETEPAAAAPTAGESTAPQAAVPAAGEPAVPVAAPAESEPTPAAEAPAALPKPAAEAAKPPVRRLPSSQPQPEPDLLAQILAEPLYLAAGGGALVLLLGLGLFLARRRQAEEEAMPVRPMPPARKAEPVAEPTTTVAAAGAALADLDIPDVPDSLDAEVPAAAAGTSSLGNFDNIADPLGEADIYIAYGKYPQAEELLKATLAKDPERHEARIKLLECYAETHNRSAFEAEALRLKDAASLDSSIAARVAALFENAWHGERFTVLGVTGAAAPIAAPSADDIFANLDVGEPPAPAVDSEPEFQFDESAGAGFAGFAAKPAEEKFEFDLSEGAAMPSPAEAMDFHLETPPAPAPVDEDFSFALAEEPAKPLEEPMDFDLSDELALGAVAEHDLSSLNAEDEDLLAGSDEASTKLDLARAYIDMGDLDGARDILNEVMAEGSIEQKQEAEALLGKLA